MRRLGRVSTVRNGGTAAADVYAEITAGLDPLTQLTVEGYDAKGGIQRLALDANKLVQRASYNALGQMKDSAMFKVTGSAPLMTLKLDYATGANNGNLTGQSLWIGGSASGGNITGAAFTASQSYGYDGLNRLTSAQEGANWAQVFDQDQWGNRWIVSTLNITIPTGTPVNAGMFNAKNQLTSKSYDEAGNGSPVDGRTYRYDVENRLVSATGGTAETTESFVYDGDGRRVKRVLNGVATTYVYDAFGQLAQEYGGSAGTAGRSYLFADHLGSTRMMTDGNGVVQGWWDYLPYGEEIAGDRGGRSSVAGWAYGGAKPSMMFTGQVRDRLADGSPSGLDYFGARYMSAAQGRFTSPDPLLSSAHIAIPQSWNRYTYTLNNPLRFTDPFGLYICNGTNAECKDFESALKQVERARNSFKKGSSEYNALNGTLQAYGKKGVDNGVSVQFGATKSGGAGDTAIGISIAAGTANKTVTADNPSGQNTVVTFDLSKHMSNGSVDIGSLAISAAHEGIHVGHGTALVGALPTDLTSPGAAGVLGGALNLTKYATEFAAYSGSSFTAQGLGVGSLKIGGNFEIWNSGWKAVDVNTLRSNGINGVLSDPNGLYKVTPGAPGKKLIE